VAKGFYILSDKEITEMGRWSDIVESPDPRFEIVDWGENDRLGYCVQFPEEDEDGNENPNFENPMPNGEDQTNFDSYSSACEFVKEMAKYLD
jgi:hypothetical protein